MGSFVQNAITDAGNIMLAKVQAGAVFEATRIVMGSGYIPAGKTAETMTDVVAPVVTLSLNKIKASNDGMVTYGGVYSNKEVSADFYFRELALFARVKNEDGTTGDEVLYSYGNFGDTADLMVKYSTAELVEKQIDLVVWIGNDTAITLELASGVYITEEQRNAPGGFAALDDGANINMENGGTVKNLPAPVEAGDAVPFGFALPLSGGTMTGPVNMGGNAVKNLPAPVEAGDAATKNYVDKRTVPSIPRPNLLDNWYFANPVNQRGRTEYTGMNLSIDRWYINSATATMRVVDNGIYYTGNSTSENFLQVIEAPQRLAGKTLTASILYSESSGTVVLGAVSLSGSWFSQKVLPAATGVSNLLEHTFTVPAEPEDAYERLRFFIQSHSAGGSITVQAVKLEVGDTQTLAHQDSNGNWVLNEIPDYGEQLARCQRYFVRLGLPDGTIHIGTANVHQAKAATGIINLPAPMRVAPTIKIIAGAPLLIHGADTYAIGSLSTNHLSGSVLYAQITGDALTEIKGGYAIRLPSAIIEFSADL